MVKKRKQSTDADETPEEDIQTSDSTRKTKTEVKSSSKENVTIVAASDVVDLGTSTKTPSIATSQAVATLSQPLKHRFTTEDVQDLDTEMVERLESKLNEVEKLFEATRATLEHKKAAVQETMNRPENVKFRFLQERHQKIVKVRGELDDLHFQVNGDIRQLKKLKICKEDMRETLQDMGDWAGKIKNRVESQFHQVFGHIDDDYEDF
ncbi:hypothetical protein BGZ83_004868 [Gryganskiella cystojenkinii]|nr:hypothetical protein BGZ83_004868 [Gryganskiella cystojenkinii]